MKIVITGNDHSVDVEAPDDMPGLDCNELAALARDLYEETRKPLAPRMGFERNNDG